MIKNLQSRRALTRTASWLVILASGAIVSRPLYAAEIFTFNLQPTDGMVAGPPGTTVGWGYSIENKSATDWLVTTSLNSDPFLFGSPMLLFDFPDLAPGATVSLAFNEGMGAGLYQLTWDSSAPLDFTNFGTFSLSAQWWTGDPLTGGVFLQDAPDSAQAYLATVSQITITTPEPSTIVLELPLLWLILHTSKKVSRRI